MNAFEFGSVALPDSAETLRGEVREFLARELGDYPPRKRAESWTGFSAEFSKKIGDAGWIGLTWPKQYGGHERSYLERYVVIEETLAAGAPVAAHWIADRQSGPTLLRFGTEEQRQAVLPKIAAGECFFCIGMSEPDSGSDLASIRSRATKTDNGWLLSGTKVWTSNAHNCHYMIGLFRSDPKAERKHDGISQFLIPLDTPGIQISPIPDLIGQHHFNQVIFDDVELPAEALIGKEGEGWRQVMAELAYERAGPERYLSTYPLLVEMIAEATQDPGERHAVAIGRTVAHLATLRRMSLSVAGQLQAGEDPALAGSIVKDLGNSFEQAMTTTAYDTFDQEPSFGSDSDLNQVMAFLTQVAPSFSLRGGTREILRGIIARGLGLR